VIESSRFLLHLLRPGIDVLDGARSRRRDARCDLICPDLPKVL
jgi:hypothetical protein